MLETAPQKLVWPDVWPKRNATKLRNAKPLGSQRIGGGSSRSRRRPCNFLSLFLLERSYFFGPAVRDCSDCFTYSPLFTPVVCQNPVTSLDDNPGGVRAKRAMSLVIAFLGIPGRRASIAGFF